MSSVRHILTLMAGAILAEAISGSAAQTLRDPTRPPAVVGPAHKTIGSGAHSGWLLQSVMISATGSSAIINGQHVSVGQKIGDARLMKVLEAEVVLLQGGTPRRLKLFPGVDKRAPAKPTRHGRIEESK